MIDKELNKKAHELVKKVCIELNQLEDPSAIFSTWYSIGVSLTLAYSQTAEEAFELLKKVIIDMHSEGVKHIKNTQKAIDKGEEMIDCGKFKSRKKC